MPFATADALRQLVKQIIVAKQAGVMIEPTEEQIAEAQRIAQQQNQTRTLQQIITDYNKGKK